MTLIATLIANPTIRNLDTAIAENVASLFTAKDIIWLGEGAACDIELPSTNLAKPIEDTARKFLTENQIDLAIQKKQTRRKKALIADMDSTMIDQECIDELAAEVGLKEKVAAITAKAMNGEIEFEPAVRERVALLAGLETSVIDSIIEKRITLASGGHTLVQTMKANQAYTALVSGGFTSFTSRIGAMLGFEENRANRLEEAAGRLTGKVIPPILGAEAKVEALNDIAKSKSLNQADFIAVGDGANDLPMLKIAGTGVALHAKPSVAAQASICINHGDLTALLYLQGYKESEFVYS